MHLQPVFAGCEVTYPRPLPAREGRTVAEVLCRDGLCLPSGTAMAQADLARVAGVIGSRRRQAKREVHGGIPLPRRSNNCRRPGQRTKR
ncbi:MAG: hypothetical protein ACP5UQ_07660 [Anaerolineae bacterium]